MTRIQILILAILAVMVCILFGAAVVMARSMLLPPPAIVKQPTSTAPLVAVATPTWTPVPTRTFTPTPVDTPLPTPTNTRVVVDTATPTPSATPTQTLIPTITPTLTRGRSGSGSTGGAPATPQPTSRYPFKIIEGPLVYDTKNYFFVVYARVSSGGALLPGYRLVGTHSPTGVNIRSEPSCSYLCRASGPKREKYLIQEGNLVFEAFFYDTGAWSLMLIDPQGQQASEVLNIQIDKNKRVWLYYHFSR